MAGGRVTHHIARSWSQAASPQVFNIIFGSVGLRAKRVLHGVTTDVLGHVERLRHDGMAELAGDLCFLRCREVKLVLHDSLLSGFLTDEVSEDCEVERNAHTRFHGYFAFQL